MRNARTLALALASALAWPATARSSDPPTPDGPKAQAPVSSPVEPPIPIILEAPADRDSLLKKLSRPDLVILDGEDYRKLRQGPGPAKAPTSASPVVESVAATGEVVGDWAKVAVEFRISLDSDGPAWATIHLDGLNLAEAREGARDLPSRTTESRSWQVELVGKGGHDVRVALMAPIRSTTEGRRLELAIPPAASTRVDLRVPKGVQDATAGVNEPVAVVEGDGGGARLSARLGPRPRIELSWRERADPAVKLPTILSAQGDIAITVDRDSIQSRSAWVVASSRGSVGSLSIRFDPAEVLMDVAVDDRPVPFESRVEGGRPVVEIPLADPIRPNFPRRLTLNTRRPIDASRPAHVGLQGYSIDRAKVQTGMIAVARVGPLFLSPTPGRGLRRIDPRTELKDSLRTRADTVLAFEFNEQPFELGLDVEPAPPRLAVAARTTIQLDPSSARVQSRLDCRVSQGRVLEVQVLLPRGLEFEGVDPPDVAGSSRLVPVDPKGDAGGIPAANVPRVLSIGLAREARENDSFSLVLNGWCAVDPSGPVALPLFRPLAGSTAGGRWAIVTDRNVSADLAPAEGEPLAFRVDPGTPPVDWPWPGGRPPAPESGLLWLRGEANPESLPLRMAVRPRSIRHESTLTAAVDRRGADVVEEISGEVAFGTISRLDVSVPREVPADWTVDGAGERVDREPLAREPDGSRRYRLRFGRDLADAFRARIRYRVPLGPGGGTLRLAPIRVLEGASDGQSVVISAPPDVAIRAEAGGWSPIAPPGPSDSPGSAGSGRLAFARADDEAAPLEVAVEAGPRLALPSTVASRAWIRTVQTPEDDLATTAYFWVEARDASMGVGLPAGSRWSRARVGPVELVDGDVEAVGEDEYRLKFPKATPTGPALVAIDYVVPAALASGPRGWQGPRLLEGAVVQQVAWEVQLAGTRAGIGTPEGWADENEWYWDGLIFKRRPRKGPAELAQWLTAGSSKNRVVDPLESGEPGGRHRYLFGRVGPPGPLRFAICSRSLLLLGCSGPILLAGLLVLARRPPPRAIAASAVVLAFLAGALVDPDVLILAAQASSLGVGLSLIALAMNRTIERRGRGRPSVDRPPALAPSSTGPSIGREPAPPPPVGSDESTAIRPRPGASAVSTADHIILARRPDELPTPGRELR